MVRANAPYSQRGKSGPQIRAEMINDDDESGERLTVMTCGWVKSETVKLTRLSEYLVPRLYPPWQSRSYFFGTEQR